MVFIHCKNCGHDKHEGRCGNTRNHLAIACMCSNYEEGRVDDIRRLTDIIQSVNKQDSTMPNNSIFLSGIIYTNLLLSISNTYSSILFFLGNFLESSIASSSIVSDS